MYSPGPIPAGVPQTVQRYLREELRRIAVQFTTLNNLGLESLAEEPAKPVDGQVVYADGTNWNPGSGEGMYGYYNATWNALGGGGGGGIDAVPGIFEATSAQTLGTTTSETVEFDSEVYDPDSNYTLDGNNEITVATAGTYFVAVNLPLDDGGTSGAARAAVDLFMEQDATTGTWAEPSGSIRGRDYARETDTGSGVHCAGVMVLLEDEKIRARAYKSTNNNRDIDEPFVSLHIFRIA